MLYHVIYPHLGQIFTSLPSCTELFHFQIAIAIFVKFLKELWHVFWSCRGMSNRPVAGTGLGLKVLMDMGRKNDISTDT
jgi:hypothetical protein